MRENPLKIAITPEQPVDDEASKITSLLSAGDWRIHLRHPGASRREISDIIGKVDPRLHSRIVLHGHFDLINDFNIGGLHLNRRCPVAPAGFRGRVSCSCHSIEELLGLPDSIAYATLSPVFDSISKAGYTARLSDADLRRLDDCRVAVVALGGVTPEHLESVRCYNFAGYAVLGFLHWEASETEFLNQAKRFS